MISDAANRLAGVVSKVALPTSAVVAGRNTAMRMRAVLVAAIVITVALALSAAARAATITVNSLADTGASGICVLHDAITAANTMTATNGCAAGDGDDTIQFSVTGTIALASTLPQITDSNLTIHGPASPGIKIDGGGEVQVMQVASGTRLNLRNLMISDGFVDDLGSGSGIYNGGTLTITNSTVSDNSAGNFATTGGGIYNAGRLTITNSTFSGNSAASGGGIYNVGTLTVTNSSFINNAIATVEGGDGGGIHNVRGTLVVTNCIFSGNSAGGGLGGGGGGISNGGTLAVINSTFDGNEVFAFEFAAGGGGIVNDGTLTITNSTFDRNEASADYGTTFGGGIDNSGALTIINSTFAGNEASTVYGTIFGGGGISNSGTLTITNSTFAGNAAFAPACGFCDPGSGIYNVGTLTSKSSILAANSGGNCSGTITDASYNISDDDTCGFSASGSLNNIDPQLDSAGLRNNGGPTKTIALLSGSPAIDAIPVADCTDLASPRNPIITDQRLFPRPDAGEPNCDIGAYEVQDTSFVPFSSFHGHLGVHPNMGIFYLDGGFKLGAGSSIDLTTQAVAFSVGSYAIRAPIGSFVKHSYGYVYQQTVNGIFLRLSIKFTGMPDRYVLLAYRKGGTLTGTTGSVPVTLTIGDNSGSTLMNAKFN